MSVAVKYFLIYLCESAWPTMSDVFPGKVDLDETKKETEGDRQSNKINLFLPQVAVSKKVVSLH